MSNGLEGYLLARQLMSWFRLPVALPPFFQMRDGREKFLIVVLDSLALPLVVADLMETVLLCFSFSFSLIP